DSYCHWTRSRSDVGRHHCRGDCLQPPRQGSTSDSGSSDTRLPTNSSYLRLLPDNHHDRELPCGHRLRTSRSSGGVRMRRSRLAKFMSMPTALVGIGIIFVVVASAVLAPYLTPYDPMAQDLM